MSAASITVVGIIKKWKVSFQSLFDVSFHCFSNLLPIGWDFEMKFKVTVKTNCSNFPTLAYFYYLAFVKKKLAWKSSPLILTCKELHFSYFISSYSYKPQCMPFGFCAAQSHQLVYSGSLCEWSVNSQLSLGSYAASNRISDRNGPV